MFLQHPFTGGKAPMSSILSEEGVADAVPERKRTIAYEADALLRDLAANGDKVADRVINMIQSKQQILFLPRINIAMMMLRQHQGRPDRPENPVVDRGDFGNLQGFDRGMDDGSAQAFIISRAAGRRRDAKPVSPEHFEHLIIDINLGDNRAVHALQGEFVQANIRGGP